jgi:hypothetical protein
MLNQYEYIPRYTLVNDEPKYIVVNGGGANVSEIVQKIFAWILFLSFQGFVIYAVVISDDTSIINLCGGSLSSFIVTHFVINILEAIIYVFWSNVQTCVKDSFIITELLPFTIAIVMHAILLGVGINVCLQAIPDVLCWDALSSVSPTQGPMLGYVAYVYIGLDIIILIIITCWGLYEAISRWQPKPPVALTDSTKAAARPAFQFPAS